MYIMVHQQAWRSLWWPTNILKFIFYRNQNFALSSYGSPKKLNMPYFIGSSGDIGHDLTPASEAPILVFACLTSLTDEYFPGPNRPHALYTCMDSPQ